MTTRLGSGLRGGEASRSALRVSYSFETRP